jgi:hypothetical protein
MKEKYNIIVASDDKYDKVVIEIYYNEKFVGLISQEEGKDKLQIEFPSIDVKENVVIRKIPLNEFLKIIEEAKNILFEESI